MTKVSNNIKERIEAKICECIDIAENAFGRKFPMPQIDYTVRGTVAGYAYDHQYRVNFNPILLNENVDDFIARTVPHEFAHLVDGIVFPETRDRRGKRSVHGPTWKRIMMMFGADPSRCHSYDTSNANMKKKNKFEYRCAGCGGTVVLGPVRHKKQQNAEAIGKQAYSHGTCRGALLEFVGALGQVSYSEAAQGKKKAPNKKSPKQPKSGTKRAKALTIVQDIYGKGHGREITIQRIIDVLGMSRAGATTYFYNAKKELGL